MKKLRLFLILPMMLFLASCGMSSEETTRKFMGHIYKGEHLHMQDMLASDTKQMMTMFYGSINNSGLKPYYRTGQMMSYTIQKMDETDLSARYGIKIVGKTGKVNGDFIDLTKEDGDWKITSF
jgi:hypothetical protein